ncbi:MAG: hypothetical protein PWQ91_413 [Eubacteriales bacterium]|nr:hypothetical protein [Eubacteriales bacterium]MDN5363352.1 hypothetical protein [Eubacteriales bacterium]
MQWFYDDTGYYSYVLLNAGEVQFKKVQEILKREGLQVLLAGRSYRPASNGRQYQWYIRVADESGRHPRPDRIARALAACEAQEEDIRKLQAELSAVERRLNAAEHRYQATKERLECVLRQYQELQKTYNETRRELQECRERAGLLESQLRQIRESGLKPEEIAKIREEYEGIVRDRQRLAEKLAKTENELNSLLSEYDREVQERDRKIVALEERCADLQGQVDELAAENARLATEKEKMEAVLETRRKGKPLKDLFCRMFEVFLPNVCFLRGSLDTLWHEVPDPVDAVRVLTTLDQLKGKRVRSTEETGKWLERRFQGDWRLYYKRCDDGRYKVLISHKKTQDTDIEWLKSVDC